MLVLFDYSYCFLVDRAISSVMVLASAKTTVLLFSFHSAILAFPVFLCLAHLASTVQIPCTRCYLIRDGPQRPCFAAYGCFYSFW